MEKMAESISRMPLGPFRSELLFCSTLWRARESKVTWHQHSHWQLELVLGGPIFIRTDAGTVQLDAGDIALLPTGSFHEFSYPREPVGWITLRFTIHGSLEVTDAFILRHGGIIDGFTTVLRDLLEGCDWPPQTNVAAAAGHCIAALAAYVYLPQSEGRRREGQPSVARADEFMTANTERRVSVEEVAQMMGYSVSHASALYRQETGNSLKWAIDNARAQAAQRQLIYSDQRISDVAESMGFVDVYAFSRFIKRVTGKSPRQYRRTSFQTKSC